MLVCCCIGRAQDTLPNFSVVMRGERVVVSWVNPYQNCVQLNVQRSYDSLRFFNTVFTAASPNLPQNGYSEVKPPTSRIYYRIFYVLEGGTYFFTTSKKPVPDTATRTTVSVETIAEVKNQITVTVKNKNEIIAQIPGNEFRSFRDSILKQTKDTLFALNDSTIELRKFVPKEIWRPSHYVFTRRDGYVSIVLPDVKIKRYRIRFFEEDGTPLFDIAQVKEPMLVLDKSNFVHAGWFHFELYEDEKLKEKNKFYLPKDF